MNVPQAFKGNPLKARIAHGFRAVNLGWMAKGSIPELEHSRPGYFIMKDQRLYNELCEGLANISDYLTLSISSPIFLATGLAPMS